MLRRLDALWPWLAAIASGLLCAACFPPYNQSWLCWIALTPLLTAVWFSNKDSRQTWLRNLLFGYLAGIVFFTCAFSWLGALGDLYQNLFLHSLSLLLSTYLALYFAFWSWFAGLIRPKDFTGSHRNLLAAFLGACAWATLEWVRGWLFSGFGWNGLGVALHQNWPLIQIAEFTGVTGLSFAVVFTNVIAVCIPIRLFNEARTHRMRPHFDLTLTMIGLVALIAFGLHTAQNQSPASPLRVAAIQTNIPQIEKFQLDDAEKILKTCDRLSALAVQRVPNLGLMVWPESSVPGIFGRDTWVLQFSQTMAQRSGTDLLLGVDNTENDRGYNAALLVSPTGQSQLYRKVHLVPFGEYIPLRHSFPLFAAIASSWVPGDFAAGTEHTVFHLTNGGVRVAPLICFEDTVGDLVRHFVLNGADLLVDITNDGWFLRSVGSQQHLANARFRCVENRRPMVRAANTGVTCFIDEFGRLIRATSYVGDESGRITDTFQDATGNTFTEGVLTGVINLPVESPLTFYTRHAEWFAECCAVVTVIAVLAMLVIRRKL